VDDIERATAELDAIFREHIVPAVLRGSRAEQAGLRVGDVLVEVNGRPVVTVDAVREALLAVPLDRALPLVVRRDGDAIPVVIVAP
jgi:S1-C subfamily serine protease